MLKRPVFVEDQPHIFCQEPGRLGSSSSVRQTRIAASRAARATVFSSRLLKKRP